MKDKQVLLVSHNLSVSGAPLLLAETGVEMARAGAFVTLTSLGPTDPEFRFSESNGLKIVDINESLELASAADLIVVNTAVVKTWVSDLLSRDSSAARKIVWWIHEVDMETYATGMDDMRKVGAAVFDSEICRQLWLRAGLTPPIAETVHPGVSDEWFDAARQLTAGHWKQTARYFFRQHKPTLRDQIRAELGVGPNDFLVGNVAQYCPLKGQDLLIQTIGSMLEESPDLPLKLFLVGFPDEPQRQAFLKQRNANELRATDGPARVFCRVANPKPYYLAADVFVLNTQWPGETFGMVTIEAMAFGLPVLSTRTGGTAEVIVDGVTGFLYPPGSNGRLELSNKLRLLMSDRRRTRALGKAGLSRLNKQFRADRFYRELSDVFSRVMSPAI